MLLFTVAGLWWTGLSYDPSADLRGLAWLMALAAFWAVFVALPGRSPKEWLLAESLLVFLLLMLFGLVTPIAQYPAIAMMFPLADGWLVAMDAAMGIHVPTLNAWTAAHPIFAGVLQWSYASLLPQFAIVVPVLGAWLKDRDALWEFAAVFHLCSIITVIVVALCPAMAPAAYFGFDPIWNGARFIDQFAGLRDGTLLVVRSNNLEGMVTMPSFHAAGGMMVTWAFRRHRVWFWPLLVVNTLLVLSTVLLGAHYAADVVGAVAMWVFSLWVYRRFLRIGVQDVTALGVEGLHGVSAPNAPNKRTRR